MTTGSNAAGDGHSGIPRGAFGLHTLIQLSPRQDYALPSAPYQDFSGLVRRGANPEWNLPRHPNA